MSDSPKLCVPAYELLQARYHPEEAAKVYKEMTPFERVQTEKIMALLQTRKDSLNKSCDYVVEESLPNAVVVEDCPDSENVYQYLRHFGYKVQFIPATVPFSNNKPILVIEW